MSSGPQLENGYTRIADEILEALARTRIPGEQMQCLLVIIRKTWGWGKKEDQIPLSQIAKATGITKPHVCRALKELEKRKIIVAKKGNDIAKSYRINKHYEEWKSLPKKVTLPKKVISIAKKGNGRCQKRQQALPLLGTSIDTISINTLSKDTLSKDIDSDFDLFWTEYPKKKSKGQAKKTWGKLKKAKTLPDLQTLLDAIVAQKAGHDWQKEGGQYIPYPSTWLNNEGWLDETSARLPQESKATRRLQSNLAAMHRAKDLIK